MLRVLLVLCCALFAVGCRDEAQNVKDYNKRIVTLPDGSTVRAETMVHQIDMARGMMYRDSLPEGEGMLFIHGQPGKYSYWMFNVKVPLDIVWMDKAGTVLEISENTPPCRSTVNKECPSYGGSKDAMVVLELPAGYARKHGVFPGSTIRL